MHLTQTNIILNNISFKKYITPYGHWPCLIELYISNPMAHNRHSVNIKLMRFLDNLHKRKLKILLQVKHTNEKIVQSS